MKNISDQIDELKVIMNRLDKKLDEIIHKNSPPEEVIELFDKIRKDNE